MWAFRRLRGLPRASGWIGWLFLASASLVLAQPYGLTERPIVAPFLGNRLPATAPSATSGWSVVQAFPNLSFRDPIFMIPGPNSNQLYLGTLWGIIYRFTNDPNTATRSVFLDLSDRTQVSDNSGMYSMAFHPEFGRAGSPNRGYVYVCYQYSPNPVYGYQSSFNRLSRFTVPDGSTVADRASEQVLIHQFDPHVWHNGGSVCFADDGFLYVAFGQAGGSRDFYNTTQQIDAGLFSGVLRIDVNRDPAKSHPIRRQPRSLDANTPSSTANYYIPNDNPFVDPGGSVLEEFWAIGFRSPHRMTYDPGSRQLWLGDVGENRAEEVNLVRRGGNYGWAFREGLDAGPKPRPATLIGTEMEPTYWYYGGDGNNSVIGGYVYRGREHAALLDGLYLFGDNGSGRVWALNPTGGQPVFLANLTGSGLNGLSSFGLDQNSEVYLLKLGVDGRILKLARTSTSGIDPPPLLSQTGAFSNVATLTPAAGLIPYDVNSALWSDNSAKRRWMAIPNDGAPYGAGEVVTFAAQGPWAFPAGSVFIKHFDLPVDDTNPSVLRRIETRLLVRDNAGGVYGLTYKWRPDGSDADLLAGGLTEDISVRTASGTRTQSWFYPSRQACLSCHGDGGFQVLAVNTRQLNGNFTYPSGVTDNQLRTLSRIGLFSTPLNEASIPSQERMVAVTDTSASHENRVRSYLDANCAHCHFPGGGRGFFDARYLTPLNQQGIIDGPLATSLGGPDARVIAPGSIERSLMHSRINTTDDTKMPPLARSRIDVGAVTTLEEWIMMLRAPDPLPAPWSNQEVGPVLYAGSVSTSAGVFIVRGAGADIWGTEDSFHFMSQPWTGDGEIVARVQSVQNTDPWAKAGVMFRESYAAGAKNAFMLFTPSGNAVLQYRPTSATASTQAPLASLPGWVKLVRSGSTFMGYISTDGITWTPVGSTTIAMAQAVYVGLAVTSHSPSTLCAAQFDNVMVSGTGAPTVPAAPGSLIATAMSSSRIDLAWSDNSNNESGFAIERATGTAAFSQIATVGANTTTYANTGLTASTAYSYRVRALGSGGNSAYSNTASATTLATDPPPPPSGGWQGADVGAVGLAGSQDTSGTPITVRGSGSDVWGAADAFRFVYQSLSGDGTITAQVTSVTNTDGWAKAGVMIRESLAPNAPNIFAFVAAANGLAVQNRATAGGATTSTAGPWGVTAPYWVRLARTGSTIVASASANGTTWTTVATHTVSLGADVLVGLAVTSHNNAALCTGTFANVSIMGGSAPPPPATVPAAPTGLTAVAASATQINLAWTDASTNESGFEVERSIDNVTFTLRTTTGANVATFADTGLAAATTYYYRVRAVNTAGNSAYSNVANATTPTASSTAPANLVATAVSAARIDLTWTDNAPNEDAFQIERSLNGTTFTQIATTAANATTYSDTGLAAATQYTYRVRAVFGATNSAYSNTALATTLATDPPPPPSGGWQGADVGAVGLAGSQDTSGTPIIVRGSGSDIWGSADAFRFVYQSLSGDGTITAQVTGVTNTDGWAKAGVMIRESLAANAPNTFAFVAAANGLAVQNRATAGGATTSTAGPWGVTAPYWVRLARTGSTIVASASANGTTWTTVATHTVSLGADVLVGLAVTSHNNAALCTGTFANVSITGGGAPPPPTTTPAAPTGLTAAAASATQINLAWTDASTNESGFEVERSIDNVTFTLRTTTGANVATFADTGLTAATTYYYRVRAVNTAGNSAYSNVANATTPTASSTAPTSLVATAVSTARIDLTWTDNAPNEDAFQIERSLNGTTFTQIATTAANVTTYSDTGLTAATQYTYRVRAGFGTTNSAYSNTASATTLATDPPPPPSGGWQGADVGAVGLAGSQDTSGTPITVRGSGSDVWGAADAFRFVYQSLSGDGTITAQVTGVTNTDGWAKAGVMIRESLAPNAPNTFAFVAAANGLAVQNRATAGGATTSTAGPWGVTAPYWVRLARTGSTIVASASPNGTTWTTVATHTVSLGADVLVGLAVTSHNNAALCTGTFANVSITGGGAPPPPATAPAAPTGLTAVAASATQINLAWTDASTNESGFEVERSTDNVTFTLRTTTGANVATFADTGLAAATTYYYRVRAVNTAGNSSYSNVANAKTADATPPPTSTPAAPTGLTAVASSATQINLAWTDASTNESGFEVERSTDNVTFTLRTTTGANIATFADTGLTAATTYYYRVRAVNTAGNSAYSNVANAKTADVTPPPTSTPAAPTGLTAVASSATQINLAWTDTSTNESGFEVQRSTDNVTFTVRTTTGANVGTFADTGLAAATTYYYRVRAVNTAGSSAYSNVANATTAAASSTAPTNLVATAVSATRIDLTWTDNAPNEDAFRLERLPDGTTFTQIATTAANVTTYSDLGVTAGITYTYRVRAAFGLATSAYSNLASATPSASAATWSFGDIGAVGVAGSNTSTANTITISGSGSDIWSTSDAFRFVYRALTGDGVVEARVVSLQNTHVAAKAGVMVRESLTANSKNAFAFLTPAQRGISAQARLNTGGSTTSTNGPARNAPYWVRLTRTGNTFTAASSPDGVVWADYASFNVAMNATVYFGFAVTSHDNTRLNTAVFEDPFVQ